jgi:hypothetical protein
LYWNVAALHPVKEIKLYSLKGEEIPSTIIKTANNTYSIEVSSKEVGIIMIMVQTDTGIWTSKLLQQ